MMQPLDLNDLIEECLAELRSGHTLEQVLASRPEQAQALRPYLEAAVSARSLVKTTPVPSAAQARSRAAFLEAAQAKKRAPLGLRFGLPVLRLAGTLALALIVLLAGFRGTELVSAEAVPGQTLYPVKRAVENARLALTSNTAARLELEENLDSRRTTEAEKLVVLGDEEEVQFSGFLEGSPETGWFINNIKLILTPEQHTLARSLSGSYVEIEGITRSGQGVEVREIELRLFQLSGAIDRIEDNLWIVGGVRVGVAGTTQVFGNPQVGTRFQITALRLQGDQFLALSARQVDFAGNLDAVQTPLIETDDSENRTPSASETDDLDDNEQSGQSTPEPDDDDDDSSSGKSITGPQDDDPDDTGTPEPDDDDRSNSGSSTDSPVDDSDDYDSDDSDD